MHPVDLITAVAKKIRDVGGFPTKTKVLKLLYLLDIEEYRKSQTTLTGFDWKFYKFGPWSAMYDDTLLAAVETGRISLNSPNADEGATFINPVTSVSMSEVLPSITQYMMAERIIEVWATKPSVELLDYVYFHTAPMKDARRNEPLDFNTVLTEERPARYKTLKSDAGEGELARKRREFQERLKARKPTVIPALDPPPRYDEQYWAALTKLEIDE